MSAAAARWINHGTRLHLQHGPIDLIIEAEGEYTKTAYEAAVNTFEPLLQTLVDELYCLRTRADRIHRLPRGPVARRMVHASQQFAGEFTTPMIAVAGSVADEVLAAMTTATSLRRVCVNNGGDIAIYLSAGSRYKVAVVADPRSPSVDAGITITAEDNICGIATSGRHGRSLSCGIADAVTVLASSAATADAAATVIANAVDLSDCSAIAKVPANEVDPDSDLGEIPVTVDVGPLSEQQVEAALQHGVSRAEVLQQENLIHSAYLHLAGRCRVVTPSPFSNPSLLPESKESLYA